MTSLRPFLFRDDFSYIRDHPFKTSACLRRGGVSPCADGQKVTVHKDQKSPSKAFCWNDDGRGKVIYTKYSKHSNETNTFMGLGRVGRFGQS